MTTNTRLDSLAPCWLDKHTMQLILAEDRTSNITQRTEDDIMSLLFISASRHTAKWSDVNHLNNLELKCIRQKSLYKWDLDKIQAIKIHADHIEIAWLKIRRFDEVSSIDDPFWYIERLEEQYKWVIFPFYIAKDHTERDWFNILNSWKWKAIIAAIPDISGDIYEYFNDIISILNLNHFQFVTKPKNPETSDSVETELVSGWGYWTENRTIFGCEHDGYPEEKCVCETALHPLRCYLK